MKQPGPGPSRLLFIAGVVALCAIARMSFAQPLSAASASGATPTPAPAVAPADPAAQHPAPPPTGNHVEGDVTLTQMQVRVLAIDPAKNAVKVQRQEGNVVDIAFDPALVKVSDLRVGDVLGIGYRNAQLMRIDKMASTAIRERRESTIAWPQTNGVVASTRRVEVLATVQNIDAAGRRITLRGAQQADTVDVPPSITLDGLKTGDMVRAEFASTVAVQVQSRASQ